MIIVDLLGYMVSTESEKELHKFAQDKLGMKRSHYQEKGTLLKYPHYYLPSKKMIEKAEACGADTNFISPQELVKRAWWSKTR